MPRFVILRHTLPPESERPSHYDLMLEFEGQLLTWAMAALPSLEPQPAEELSLHRLDYLTYEGPVSNNRGEVSRWGKGPIEWLVRESDRLELRIDFGQWWGKLILQRDQNQWMVWLEDEEDDE